MFDPTFLAGPLLVVFSYALPFVEVAAGALLVLGLFTRPALVLTAATLISLFLGKIVVRDGQTAAFFALYFLITVYALRSAENNRYALDSLLCGGCCRDEKPVPTTTGV
jgi:thiosulfate dehydrogenase [quinone] large subunit